MKIEQRSFNNILMDSVVDGKVGVLMTYITVELEENEEWVDISQTTDGVRIGVLEVK